MVASVWCSQIKSVLGFQPQAGWRGQKTVNCFILHVLWEAIRELSLRSLLKCRPHRPGPSAYDADTAGLWLPLGVQEVEGSPSYRGGPPEEKLEVFNSCHADSHTNKFSSYHICSQGDYRVFCPSRHHFPHSSSNAGHDLRGLLTVLSWLHGTIDYCVGLGNTKRAVLKDWVFVPTLPYVWQCIPRP